MLRTSSLFTPISNPRTVVPSACVLKLELSKFVPLNSLHPLLGGFVFTMPLQARPSLPHYDVFRRRQRVFLHIIFQSKPTCFLYQKAHDRCSRLSVHLNSNGLAFLSVTLTIFEVLACADRSLKVSNHGGSVRQVSDVGRSPS